MNGLGYIGRLEKKNGSKNIASDVFTSAPYIEHEVRRYMDGCPSAGKKSRRDEKERWLFWFANGIENYEVIFKYDTDSIKRRELKMATGTQMVLEVKKNKLNNSS